jgi:molybdopterin molybdotransferase
VPPISDVEPVAISAADGRVLAADILAPLDLPPFDNSAVDGYAVRHADLAIAGETRLPVRGRLAAGAAAHVGLAAGTAMRIFTGAPMPDGADTVFMQEDVRVEDDAVVLPAGLKPGANRRLAGEDIRCGARLMPAGRVLRPQDVALAAASGLSDLPLRRRLSVAIFSTGDEVAGGGALRAGAIHDANRPMLKAMLTRLGADISDLGVISDARAPLAGALKSAAVSHDLILTTGGVSTGEEDHVKAAVESAGSLVFWRIGVKPGRPVALGVIDGCAFAGLPGNPVAAFVTFAFVVRPLIAQLSGAVLPPLYPVTARAGFAYRKKKNRREYVRVVLRYGEGAFVARKFPQDGAGIIASLTETDGLAELAEDVTRVEPGDAVSVYPYAQLM